MSKVSVLIPYGGIYDDWRHRLFEFVVDRFRTDFPQWEVVIGDCGNPFNRSAARNVAARLATGDVYVICDADTTYPNPSQMQMMADGVDAKTWYMPEVYYQTTEKWTLETIGGADLFHRPLDYENRYVGQPGGWRVCTASAFEMVGGFDEGFMGWGYEDTAFSEAMSTVFNKPRRLGSALHLWHPKIRAERQDNPHINQNIKRYNDYLRAANSGPMAMLRLLQENGMV